MQKLAILAILVLICTLFIPSAVADGGFFPPVYYAEDIYEPTQKGVIVFDGNTELLILQVAYEGEMNDFAWIIPVPSYPNINKTSSYIFEELHYLTEPEYKRAPNLFFGTLGGSTKMQLSEGVTVHEQMQVGIYEVTILSSENPEELINWLNNNNYSVSSKAEPVLDFYIQKGWYFIAMRINLVPYDERLINSLKKIDPSVTNSEDAVSILTNDLINYIKSKTEYNDLTTIRTTELDYGEDDEELTGDYRYEGDKPIHLITEYEYNEYYEQYNGYFEEHIKVEIQNKIRDKLYEEVYIPYPEECYGGRYQQDVDYSRCYICYFTKDSEEYQILKDVECGKYCSLISKEKTQYTMDDLAAVGAYAVVKGNSMVENYFGVSSEKRSWYDNEDDLFEDVKYQIEDRLRSTLDSKRYTLTNQLESELIAKYSQEVGSTFGSIEEMSTFFSENVFEDFSQGKKFSSSYVYGFGLLTDYEYNSLKRLFEGDHDKVKLQNNVEASVKRVVYWKQTTTQMKLGSGTVQPISIEFKTSSIIYPLKMSSVNKGVCEVLLYVFARYRTKVEGIEGFGVEYAKWIETEDIKTERYYAYLDEIRNKPVEMMPRYYLSYDTYYYLNQLIDDRYFLTKFRKEMWPKEMTDDLLITQADNNKEYRLVVYEPGYFISWIGFFIGLAFIWGIFFGACFLPRGVNNKIIQNNTESAFYMSIKRCAAYASVVPIFVFFSLVFSDIVAKLLGDIMLTFGDIFYFVFHLFNYIGMPELINGIIVFILAAAFFFLIIHLIGSFIILIYKKIKRE